MAKRGATKIVPGTAVRVRDGVSLPEFPDVSPAGWTGSVMEVKGRGAAAQYIIQWSAPTIEAMPAEYRAHCEEQGLFYEMVCLAKDDVEPLE